MKYPTILPVAAVCACLCLCAMPASAAQIVEPAQSSVSVASGSTFNYAPVYRVSAPETGLETGLGLRIHFNSSALQFNGASNVFANGKQPLSAVMQDVDDADNDSSTDQYVLASWVDYNTQWPASSSLPLQLLKASFTAKSGFTGTTYIRATASATADNTDFQGAAMSVAVEQKLKLQVRGFLQGAYMSGNWQMRDDLRAVGLLPTLQPYAMLNYTGIETASAALLAQTGNDAPVDWVLLELRSPSDPTLIVARQAALLQRDGDVVEPGAGVNTLSFGNLAPGLYYVALRHRNHLGVMTQSPVSLSSTASLIDFTLPTTLVYGEDTRAGQDSLMLLRTGDANGDNQLIGAGPNNDKNSILGVILASEQNAEVNTNFQLAGYLRADINMDGKAIFAGPNNDINILLGNILLYPANTTFSSNFILRGGLPE